MGQVAESIEISPKRLSEFRELDLAQTLYPQGFSMSESTHVEGGTKPIQGISITDAMQYWTLAAVQTKNLKAATLLAASAIESLERRADEAFGIIRTEQERNERFEARVNGKMVRRTLTDAIKDYCDRHNKSESYTKFVYSNCSDYLNEIVLGAKSKQAKEFYDLPKSTLLRNHIPVKALKELEYAEEFATRLIDSKDMECLKAMQQACHVAYVKHIGLE
jgi:hypothetical protein